jgi:hypothetical protein
MKTKKNKGEKGYLCFPFFPIFAISFTKSIRCVTVLLNETTTQNGEEKSNKRIKPHEHLNKRKIKG